VDITTILSFAGATTGLIALIAQLAARAATVSRETINDLQDEVQSLRDRIKELEAQGARDRREIHELMQEVILCRQRETALQQRVAALEAV
jgi:chromosome segregation ATPase